MHKGKKRKGEKKKRLYVLITFSGAKHDGVTYIDAFWPDDIILKLFFQY